MINRLITFEVIARLIQLPKIKCPCCGATILSAKLDSFWHCPKYSALIQTPLTIHSTNLVVPTQSWVPLTTSIRTNYYHAQGRCWHVYYYSILLQATILLSYIPNVLYTALQVAAKVLMYYMQCCKKLHSNVLVYVIIVLERTYLINY